MDFSLWKQDSFVVITGEIGSGKTTLIEKLLSGSNNDTTIIKLYQTQLDEIEFLQSMLVGLGHKPFNLGKVELLTKLNAEISKRHQQGKPVVLVVDEAQNLPPRVLEEIRLLSGLETHTEKMLNVLLVGQPELNEIIDSQGLEQLAQRVRLRFHVGPLSKKESAEYIQYRLQVAGRENSDLFPSPVVEKIFRYTGGVPRLINILCDTILMGAFVDDHADVGLKDLEAAIQELNWLLYDERPSHDDLLPSGNLSSSVDVPAKLIITFDDKLVGEYVVNKETILIGRAPNCDIQLEFPKVSGTHASLVSNRRESIIVDLGSTNGTYMDGKAIKKRRLKDGDIIYITRNIKIQYFLSEKTMMSASLKKSEFKVIKGRDDTIDSTDSIKSG